MKDKVQADRFWAEFCGSLLPQRDNSVATTSGLDPILVKICGLSAEKLPMLLEFLMPLKDKDLEINILVIKKKNNKTTKNKPADLISCL